MNGRWRLHCCRSLSREAAFADVAVRPSAVVRGRRRTTGSDWLPTFEFGLANDSSCLKRPVRVSGAEGRFTLKLDARQSSSRRQPPALNVDRPTAASRRCHRRRRTGLAECAVGPLAAIRVCRSAWHRSRAHSPAATRNACRAASAGQHLVTFDVIDRRTSSPKRRRLRTCYPSVADTL